MSACVGRLTSCDSEARKAKEAKQAEEESTHCWSSLFWHVECAMKEDRRKLWVMSSVFWCGRVRCVQCVCSELSCPVACTLPTRDIVA